MRHIYLKYIMGFLPLSPALTMRRSAANCAEVSSVASTTTALEAVERFASFTTGFATPVGTPATVSATVTCVVELSDLALPGVPGTRTVTVTVTSPLDTYRER